MRIRKLLLTGAAIAAAGALALAPTASANTPTGGPIAEVYVDGNGAANNDITATMKSANVAITVYGFIPLNLTCTAGSASGEVDDGSPVVNPVIFFDVLSLSCPSIFPDTTVEMDATCNVGIGFADNNVHDGLVDTGTGTKFNRVAGTANFNDCVTVTISNGCTFTIGGTATAAFDEALKGTGTVQDLHLTGTNTLRINDPVNCAGAVSDNQAFTLNAVFNINVVDGGAGWTIDFQQFV